MAIGCEWVKPLKLGRRGTAANRYRKRKRDRLNYSLGREFSTRDRKAYGFAVDAPTIIPNATGMRLPDKLSHKHFGRYHAGCYPANLNRPFAQNTVAFGEA